ncbi:unnamed protein product [Effrenium voratum]|nr:unnamed protein product [Effrenium voratum]
MGYTLHYTCGKGDWKWRREWLEETRHYSKATRTANDISGQICRRCLAGTSDKPWLDFTNLQFHNQADMQEAARTSTGPDCAIWNLSGWRPSMECADLLHCLWLGTGRDAIGSFLLELAEHCPTCARLPTWDDRLHSLTLDAREWAREHSLPPSVVDEWSAPAACMLVRRYCFCMRLTQGLLRLGVDAVTLDYPKGSSNAYCNRVVCLGAQPKKSLRSMICKCHSESEAGIPCSPHGRH